MQKKLKFLLPFLALTQCLDKPVIVSQEDRQTLTFLSDAQISKEESKKSFSFPSSVQKFFIKETPHVFSINHNSSNLVYDQEYIYLMSSKGVERFSLKERKFLKSIPLAFDDKKMLLSIHQNYLVILGKKGKIVVIDLKTKKPLFEKNLEVTLSTKALIDQNVFYVQTAGNEIFCFDLKTGKEVWTYKNQPGLSGFDKGSSPILYKNFLITGFTTGDFSVIDKTNGLLQWNDSLYGQIGFMNTDIMHVTSKPIVKDDILYAIGVGDNLSVYKIHTGEVIWSKKIGSHLDILLNGLYLYILDNKGILIALNKNNGNVRMVSDLSTTLNMPRNFSNMFIVNNQLFFATIHKKGTQCVFINPQTGVIEKIMWIKGLMKDVTLYNNQIFVLTDKKLYVLTD